MQKSRSFILLFSAIILICSAVKVSALSDAEKTFLSMYFSDEELRVVSATRSLKSVARVAENITVVTWDDIELMNAHTVADVLENVNGVQMRKIGGAGAFAYSYIQSSDFRHVAVFMDGIPLNLLADNVSDVAAIPVQIIEKIEIVRGPSSSVWGSSLGGIINILTKSGSEQKRSGGTLYSSVGEQSFHDVRAELYGKTEKIGYYFYVGRRGSDGYRGLPEQSGISFNDYNLSQN